MAQVKVGIPSRIITKWRLLISVKHHNDGSSASDKVFALPERLETILLDVPIRDVLVNAQRVSRVWHQIIHNSKTMQRALLFEPVPMDPVKSSLPLKRSDLLHEWNTSSRGREVYQHIESTLRDHVVVRNPLLDILADCWYYTFPAWHTAMRRSEASWRRMLLSQPTVEFTVEDFTWLEHMRLEESEIFAEVVGDGRVLEGVHSLLSLLRRMMGWWVDVRFVRDVEVELTGPPRRTPREVASPVQHLEVGRRVNPSYVMEYADIDLIQGRIVRDSERSHRPRHRGRILVPMRRI